MQRTFSVFGIISLGEIFRSRINGSNGMGIFQGSGCVLLNISKEPGVIFTLLLLVSYTLATAGKLPLRRRSTLFTRSHPSHLPMIVTLAS